MLSRVADSVYWLSRYLERAENTARFIHVNLQLALESGTEEEKLWGSLIQVTGDQVEFLKKYRKATRKNVLKFLTFDLEYPNSIYASLAMARENARRVREIISSEMWEQVNRFYLFLQGAEGNQPETEQLDSFYREVKTHHQLFTGLFDSIMSHGEAWHFMNLGKLLERADKSSRLLDVKYFILLPTVEDVGTPHDAIGWAALLRSASALEMYRKRFQEILPRDVAEFLILDPNFPRSIRHCLAHAEYSLHRISGTHMGTFSISSEQYLGKLRSEMEFTSITEIMDQGLHEFLDQLQGRLNDISSLISENFFRPHAKPAVGKRGVQ